MQQISEFLSHTDWLILVGAFSGMFGGLAAYLMSPQVFNWRKLIGSILQGLVFGLISLLIVAWKFPDKRSDSMFIPGIGAFFGYLLSHLGGERMMRMFMAIAMNRFDPKGEKKLLDFIDNTDQDSETLKKVLDETDSFTREEIEKMIEEARKKKQEKNDSSS